MLVTKSVSRCQTSVGSSLVVVSLLGVLAQAGCSGGAASTVRKQQAYSPQADNTSNPPSTVTMPTGPTSTTQPQTTTKPPIAAADFCTQYRTARIGRDVDCRGGPLTAATSSVNVSTICGALGNEVTGKRVKFDASQSDACLQNVKTASCGDIASGVLADASNACGKIFSGLVAESGACYQNDDCVAGTYCSTLTDAICPASCKKFTPAGQPCTDGGLCEPGSTCLNVTSNGTTTSLCVADGGPSGVCKTTDTQLSACKAGLYCATDSQTCAAQKTAGSCGKYESACAAKFVCIGATDVAAGNCQPQKTLGSACTSGNFECEPFTFCGQSGKCELLPGIGASCGQIGNEYAFCSQGYCAMADVSATTGQCAAFLKAGSDCTVSGDEPCGGGSCVSGKCVAACSAP